jgi:hypothetical protein
LKGAVSLYSTSSPPRDDKSVTKKGKAKTTARGKMMCGHIIVSKKESMAGGFSRRGLSPLSGNDEEELEEEDEEEDEGEETDEDDDLDEEEDDEEGEEEEDDEGRKGWSE